MSRICSGFVADWFGRFLCVLLFDSKENFKVTFEASVCFEMKEAELGLSPFRSS